MSMMRCHSSMKDDKDFVMNQTTCIDSVNIRLCFSLYKGGRGTVLSIHMIQGHT